MIPNSARASSRSGEVAWPLRLTWPRCETASYVPPSAIICETSRRPARSMMMSDVLAPVQVRLAALEDDEVALAVRVVPGEELVGRPFERALTGRQDQGVRAGLGEDVELFRVDLGEPPRAELPGEEAGRAGGDLGGIRPAGERGDQDRVAKLGSSWILSASISGRLLDRAPAGRLVAVVAPGSVPRASRQESGGDSAGPDGDVDVTSNGRSPANSPARGWHGTCFRTGRPPWRSVF